MMASPNLITMLPCCLKVCNHNIRNLSIYNVELHLKLNTELIHIEFFKISVVS